MLPDGYLRTAVRDAHGHRRGRRRRLDGRRGDHPVPAGRRLGDDLALRHGRGRQPHGRRRRAPPTRSTSGVYRREAIERVGGYDETMLIAEDWELNYRIRAAGGLIWFTPDLKVTYRPRATLRRPGEAAVPVRALAAGRRAPLPGDGQPPLPGAGRGDRAQRRRPGPRRGRAHRWRWRERPHPFRTCLSGSSFPRSTWPGSPESRRLFARDVPAGVRARVPLVLAAMHTCWGAGFLTSPRRLAAQARRAATDATVGLRRVKWVTRR